MFITTGVALTCDTMKKFAKQELVKTVWIIAGRLRVCNDFKKGIRCYNGTALKYEKSKKTLSIFSLTAKTGDIFRIVDNFTFQNGKKSCVEAHFVANKI